MDNPKIAVADSARKSASGGTGRDLSPGHASYQGDEVCWYGALDVRFRPDQVLHRRSLRVQSRRPSLAADASVLGAGRVVVELSTGDSDNVELALTEEALTGFLSWLEASPPGSHLSGMAL